MIRRLMAVATFALAITAGGCAEQPAQGTRVVHRPLMDSFYTHDVIAPRAPPREVVEAVRPRRGYVWVNAYWRWDGHDYVSMPGHWEPEQSGSRYIDAHWERHRDGWHFRPGRWAVL